MASCPNTKIQAGTHTNNAIRLAQLRKRVASRVAQTSSLQYVSHDPAQRSSTSHHSSSVACAPIQNSLWALSTVSYMYKRTPHQVPQLPSQERESPLGHTSILAVKTITGNAHRICAHTDAVLFTMYVPLAWHSMTILAEEHAHSYQTTKIK